jgi:hypothetical protein
MEIVVVSIVLTKAQALFCILEGKSALLGKRSAKSFSVLVPQWVDNRKICFFLDP